MKARFVERLRRDRPALLDEAQEGADRQELIARVHQLAGSAGTFGYASLSRAASAYEMALLAGASPAIAPEFAALRAEIDRALSA